MTPGRHNPYANVNQILGDVGLCCGRFTRLEQNIVDDITVSPDPNAPAPNDASVALRTALTGTIAIAQFDLERALAETSSASGGVAPTELTAQIQLLTRLQRDVGSASAAQLADLRQAISVAVAATETVLETSRANVGGSTASATQREAAARGATLQGFRDYYDHGILNHYLRFSSAADEEEYRERERRNREAIERELAKGTPEGDARAAQIMREQLLDAKSHGADASPDFARMMQQNESSLATYRASVPEPGPSHTPAPTVSSEEPASDTELDLVRSALTAAGVSTLSEQSPAQLLSRVASPRGPSTEVLTGLG